MARSPPTSQRLSTRNCRQASAGTIRSLGHLKTPESPSFPERLPPGPDHTIDTRGAVLASGSGEWNSTERSSEVPARACPASPKPSTPRRLHIGNGDKALRLASPARCYGNIVRRPDHCSIGHGMPNPSPWGVRGSRRRCFAHRMILFLCETHIAKGDLTAQHPESSRTIGAKPRQHVKPLRR